MADKRFEKSRTNILPLLKLHVPSNILRKVTEVKSQSRSFFSAENREISKDPWTETCHNNTRSRAALLLRAAKATWRANLYQLIPFPHYPIIQFRGRTVAVAVAARPPPSPQHKQKRTLVSFFHAAYRRDIVERSPWNDEGKKEKKRREETTSILDSRFDTRRDTFSTIFALNNN